MKARIGLRRDNGFALLVVLWTLVLLGLLTTQILASGRTAVALAGNLRAAAQAKAAADGAIYEAIFHLGAKGDAYWPADGSEHVLGIQGIPVSVRIISFGGKINPNLASPGLLAGLFEALGSDPETSRQLADAVSNWRSLTANKQQAQAKLAAYQEAGLAYGPPSRPFADLSELAYVKGMTPALLANALPYLSLYQAGLPNPAQSDPIVRQALALSKTTASNGTTADAPHVGSAVGIEAVAGINGDPAIRRDAIVSIANGKGRLPFKILQLTDNY